MIFPSVYLLLFLSGGEVAVSGYHLTILHTNDVHSRYEELNKFGGPCSAKDRASSAGCFGGEARRHTAVRQVRARGGNVLLVNAGDNYQGSLYYYVHRWRVVSRFMNKLGFDAMALGNHEFDDGVSGLLPFLRNVTFPVLGTNLELSGESALINYIRKSIVLRRGGQRIGIVGYTTTGTPQFSKPENVRFLDEIQSLQTEVNNLRKDGVDKIIAVGHAGYRKDVEIGEKVDGVDVVIGGHTNTFLYNGSQPSVEEIERPYPTVVEGASGDPVLVVQAYHYGKYLGHLQVDFDREGRITSWAGNPLLLDKSYNEDGEVVAELKPFREEVESILENRTGSSLVYLDATRPRCRLEECNLGNVITDACVYKHLRDSGARATGDGWADTTIAVWNTGSIRKSIDTEDKDGAVTVGDILETLPFGDTADIVELYGKDLRATLEHAVADYNQPPGDPGGNFLQVSGLKVVYNVDMPVGSRVVAVHALCAACSVPRYEPVVSTGVYRVVMPTFMAKGGAGYEMIRANKIHHYIPGDVDSSVLIEYFASRSPIITGVEGRIRITNNATTCDADLTADLSADLPADLSADLTADLSADLPAPPTCSSAAGMSMVHTLGLMGLLITWVVRDVLQDGV